MSHCGRNAGYTLLRLALPVSLAFGPAHINFRKVMCGKRANTRAGTHLISRIERHFEVLLACQSKPPEYYLAQAHAMVRQAKRTAHIDAQRAYLKLAKRWEQLAREASAQRGNPPPTERRKPH